VTVLSLRDGARVQIRDLEPADRPRLLAGFRALSPAARLMRFGVALDELTPEMVDELMDVDGHDHVALVAVDDADPEGPGLGLARFVREPYDTRAAEAAITVAEGERGRGIGTALLAALAERAVREGITELRNYVLAENTTMRELFAEAGATTRVDGGTVLRIDLPLEGPIPIDSSAAALFRRLAGLSRQTPGATSRNGAVDGS
jgi:GNAT superfamily N-acetyltransferase